MIRQVPNKKNAMRYTIVGDGKVAKHFSQYFALLGIHFNSWSRKQADSSLEETIKLSDTVLILISDNSIEKFLNHNSCLRDKNLVHFSGTLSLNNVYGCHPLMTFSNQLYDLNLYQSIPFICDKEADFNSLFPQLENPCYFINPSEKSFYHAMCVMAGNFTQTLMRETSNELSHSLNLPTDILFPYLLQNTKNFIADPKNSATGPIQRGDFTTVKKNLQALKSKSLGPVYQSFVRLNTKQQPSLILLNESDKSNREAAQ